MIKCWLKVVQYFWTPKFNKIQDRQQGVADKLKFIETDKNATISDYS